MNIDSKKLLKNMALMVFFILGMNFIAMKFYWYTSIWWFDMPMHFFGGFFLGLLGIYSLSSQQIVKILLFVLVIGVGWEVFEIIFNNIIAQNSFNIQDTFSDICFDVSGGLSAIIYVWRKN